ncbi:MAG: alpha/beta fold hydrolase [Cyanobacteria bacterium M_surface_9_m1_291]|nr:alpha/beta fold hydrolase [Cyanobacteria bacterium M_surface_9_m1_291]
MTAPARLINGPQAAAATLLLAHGAGAPMDSPFMEAIAAGLAAGGWRVVRFEFPYMVQRRVDGRQRAPDRLPKLLDAFRAQVALEIDAQVYIGGKSMGGRIASLLAAELGPDSSAGSGIRGCLCLGYPFHPPGKPEQLRTDHLATLSTPTLILQGERDAFGKRHEVEGYTLSSAIELRWIPAGDHSFKPSRSSGLTQDANWEVAVQACDQFLRQQLQGTGARSDQEHRTASSPAP